jgi:hypothetical protein
MQQPCIALCLDIFSLSFCCCFPSADPLLSNPPCCCSCCRCRRRCCLNAGTSRATRYICLLDELGFGPDGLQVLTYWLCYLYCRCTRCEPWLA